ncbi:phytanoyl-CoA dioxygenase family protein [Sphingosinithalassobacter portus]|uniref:phytanoyl-CoA dioxygenase family protein n=1 Tax=Stakelama portus TaxID=2676234 RepID=UPI001EFDC05C|nr:phytanoyl-CoA dioxygenase family protein [Sphingosinithalassobacter portus]
MNLDEHGAAHLPGAAAPFLDALDAMAAALPQSRAGVRLTGVPQLGPLLAANALGRHAATLLGPSSRPVRAVLFDKSPETNWALGWHQDRTIAVQARADMPGFGPWTAKAGMIHVEPPFALIEAMVTVRIHLDPVGPQNAPLLIAPGSHAMGKLRDDAIAPAVSRCGSHACLAGRGDIWLYRTPIVHASARAENPTRRRVLQVDYSADNLPPPLAWSGV